MADSISVAKHRNSGAVLNAPDHVIRAARNDETDQIVHFQKFGDLLACRDQLYGVGDVMLLKNFPDDTPENSIGVCRFSPTFEQNRIAGSNRQRRNLWPDIR